MVKCSEIVAREAKVKQIGDFSVEIKPTSMKVISTDKETGREQPPVYLIKTAEIMRAYETESVEMFTQEFQKAMTKMNSPKRADVRDYINQVRRAVKKRTGSRKIMSMKDTKLFIEAKRSAIEYTMAEEMANSNTVIDVAEVQEDAAV